MNRFFYIRKRIGLSQQQTADLMHISKRHYGRVERGDTPPSSHFLEMFAKALNVGIDEIMDGSSPPQSSPNSEQEERILSLYRSLDASGRDYIYQELLMESALSGIPPVSDEDSIS